MQTKVHSKNPLVISQLHIPHLQLQFKTLRFTFLEDHISILWNTWVWVFAARLLFFPLFDFLHTYLIKLKKIQTEFEGQAGFPVENLSWHLTNASWIYYRYKKSVWHWISFWFYLLVCILIYTMMKHTFF